jgi:hypothetical protein
MPFEKADAQVLKTSLRKAQNKPLPFFYCQAGEDGEPVLIIDKRAGSLSKLVRRSAQRKKFIEGEVQIGEGNQVRFITDKKPTEGKFQHNLKMYFGKLLPRIKKAAIIHPDELVEATPSEDPKAIASQIAAIGEAIKKDGRTMEEGQLMDALDRIQTYVEATNDKKRFAKLEDRINAEFTRRDRIYEAEEEADKYLETVSKQTELATKAMAKLTSPTEKNLQRKLKVRQSLQEEISYLRDARDELRDALSA